MSPDNPVSNDDEINLYDYWKVVVAQRNLIVGVVALLVITAVVVTMMLPKIYLGEAMLKFPSREITAREIIDVIGKIDKRKLTIIFPKTQDRIASFNMTAPRDSKGLLNLRIEAYQTEDIPVILQEFIDYLSGLPHLARYYDQSRMMLLAQLERVIGDIKSSKDLLKNYDNLLKNQKLIPVGFNPIELHRAVSHLEIEKINIELTLKNLKLTEVIEKFIFPAPVRPSLFKNVIITGMLGLMLGVFIAFLVEWKKARPLDK